MANRPNRFIRLGQEDNDRLRAMEQNPHINARVKLRVQILRLSHTGMSIQSITEHVGRSRDMVCATFKRWEEKGYEGLADQWRNENKRLVMTDEIKGFVEEKIAEERTWSCPQLSEAIKEEFGVDIGMEGIRKQLHKMGYSWKRGRYVPAQEIEPAENKRHKASLETLKRGLKRGDSHCSTPMR